MDVAAAHDRALSLFSELVRGVPDDRWHDATPCEQWDVQELVNHNAHENRWVPELMAGRTVDEVGDALEGDLLGDDPIAGFDASARAAREAVEQHGTDGTVHVSWGEIPTEFYLGQRWVDLVVHGWDLAVATGQDATMPSDLAAVAYQVSAANEEAIRNSGVFAAAVEVDDDADDQTRLLALLGRDRMAWEGS